MVPDDWLFHYPPPPARLYPRAGMHRPPWVSPDNATPPRPTSGIRELPNPNSLEGGVGFPMQYALKFTLHGGRKRVACRAEGVRGGGDIPNTLNNTYVWVKW